jgi:hypothetical protein
VAKKAKVALPLAPLPDLLNWWRAQQVSGLVIGGVAVGLLGRPRITRDLDALILLTEDRWPSFLAASGQFGFVPRESDTLAFAREARVLLLRHQATSIDIDVAFGWLPFEEEAVARVRTVNVAGTSVPLPTPEDLIIMKAVAHRAQDLQDIEGLLAAQPRLDTRRVRRWVRLFAETLEMPEVYDDVDTLLRRRRPARRGKRES